MTSIISRSDAPASVSAVTSTRLADGRELLYFDDAAQPVPGGAVPGPPGLTRARPPAGEVRYDALTGEWVAVAAHRQTRTYLPPADAVPAVPEHDAETPRRSRRRITTSPCSRTASPRSARTSPAVPGAPGAGDPRLAAGGRCEVVAFTPEHTGSFAALSSPAACAR